MEGILGGGTWRGLLALGMRETAAVTAGGLLAGAVVTGAVQFGWIGFPHGWQMGVALGATAALGSVFYGAIGCLRARAVFRALGDTRERLRRAESAHARAAARTDQLAAALGQYRAAEAVLVRQINGVTESTGQAAEQLMESTKRVDATIRELIEGLERALTEAEGRDQEGTGKRRVVRDAIGAMRRYIESRREELALDRERVEAVRDRARDLSRLAHLVEDLADRTKVLAINASIEAARAGGHGRAFAVVASEVHSLAQQSARAAVEIARGLSAVRRAIHEQFASKLNPDKEAAERKLLESFADALGEIDERSDALERIHRRVLAEAREHGRRVAEPVTETFAGLQFQDVVRQRLGQVVGALDRMIRHTESLLESARKPEGPFPEPFGAEELFAADRMEPQRAAHREALGRGHAPEGTPAVELF